MLWMREYPAAFKDLVASCAQDAGVSLRRGLRFRNATDGLIALRRGYPTVMLGSVNRFKVPDNYHWPTDDADHVDLRRSVVGARERSARPVVRRARRRVGDRLLGGRHLAGEARLGDVGEQRAQLGPGRDARARARARRRGRAGPGATAGRRAPRGGSRARARGASRSPRAALSPRVATRSATESSRTSTLTGSVSAARGAGVRRSSGWRCTRKPRRRWWRARAATWARSRSLARSRREDRPRGVGAELGRGPGSRARCRPSDTRWVDGLAMSCSSAPKRSAPPRVSSSASGSARNAATGPASSGPSVALGVGLEVDRRPGAPRACGRGRRGGGSGSARRRAGRRARAARRR